MDQNDEYKRSLHLSKNKIFQHEGLFLKGCLRRLYLIDAKPVAKVLQEGRQYNFLL